MTKPTPFFVIALITLVLVFVSVWIIAAVYDAALNKRAEIHLGWAPPRIESCELPLWDRIRYQCGETP